MSGGDVVALFPLNHVLLPAMPLPLHIFEPRYRELLADVTSGPQRACFGVVFLTRGTEVGTSGVSEEPEFAEVGTIAEVLEIQPYDDGTSDLLTVGSQRFRITGLVPGKPYLQAQVDYLPETDGELSAELRDGAVRLASEYAGLLARGGVRADDDELPEDHTRLSYQLAAQLPIDPDDRQALLALPTTAERLGRIAAVLRREIALLRATRTVPMGREALHRYILPN